MIYKGCLDAFYPSTDPKLFLNSLEKAEKLEIKKVLPGHHALHIETSMVTVIADGFRKLAAADKLKQGSGVFDFGEFQIHI